MKTLLPVACMVFVALLPWAQATPAAPLQARLDRIFTPWTKGNVPGCATGATQAGRWLARRGYGVADIERGVRITRDTVFYAASVSKQFTAAAVLRLVDQGKATLDDDIREHLPELPVYVPPVRVRHLLHHTSGIPDFTRLLVRAGTLHDAHTSEEILGLLVNQQTLFPAGQTHAYSNSNYFLLAQMIHRASGSSLRKFAQANLFGPLGMQDTRFYDDASETVPRYAVGYSSGSPGVHQAVKTLYSQVGAGGLLTTINDLGKWARVFDEPGALPESPTLGLRLMERGSLADGSTIDYAFGLVRDKEAGLDSASHMGLFPGFSSSFSWLLKQRLAVFVLCNSSDMPIHSIRDVVVREALR